MSQTKERTNSFLGTYFDRDDVLRIARLAGVFAWIALGVYAFSTLISFTQFMMQFATGIYYEKGISVIDMLNYFTPYFQQIVPGLTYFAGLKFIQQAILILLDIEDNTRRSAKK